MRRSFQGFGLLEVILVFAIVIGAAAVTFSVYQSAHLRSQVANEIDYIHTASANALANYPSGNYKGASAWWTALVIKKDRAVISPNGLDWGLQEVDRSGATCTTGPCPSYELIEYYRDDANFTEDMCYGMLSALSRDYYINQTPASVNYKKPAFRSPASLANVCDKASAPLFLYLIKG